MEKTSVLVVDDDEVLRTMYRTRLESAGFEVIEASNGEEALAKAVEHKPNCVLLDIMMPRVSGFDTLDILKTTEETKDIPVIILTALLQEEAKERVAKSGAAMCLAKAEITPTQVVESIKHVLRENGQPVDKQGESHNDHSHR